ncbi:MAG: cupin [Lutibacter sp.]|uniref:cupin n=1 Tax=Lutibacter sp. TaxID=1925666 RepID=UPI00299E1C44|nr:cupin [Lutibacter sp.]MDX1829698.1 cupin [Lutibacter sp.]
MQKSSLLDNLVHKTDKPAITVLFETETTKEIRIVFKKEQFMKAHKTSFPITVEIFDGAIDFGVNGKIEKLIKGDLIWLEANTAHDLMAKKDRIVRLTLSKLDTVERVIKVSES